MPRPLSDYGIRSDDTTGMVLQDSALFDSLLLRTVEDLDLSFQVCAAAFSVGSPEDSAQPIEGPLVAHVVNQLQLPVQFRLIERADGSGLNLFAGADRDLIPVPSQTTVNFAADLISRYSKGPRSYEGTAGFGFRQLVAEFTTDFLSTGAQGALREEAQSVQLRHYLPACDRWPYPLDRFC